MSEVHYHPDADTLVRWAQNLVRIPSPQTDRFEAEPAVLDLVAAAGAILKDELGIGFRTDTMGNLIAEIGRGETGRTLMLVAYAMTHPASSMTDPYAGELITVDGHSAVRGRGVAEQKGALAACLAAVAEAHRRGVAGTLVFCVSTAGETGRHDAVAATVKALGYVPDMGIVAIGTGSEVSLGNKGRLDVDIIVHGRSSHSSAPWAGINAITGMNAILNQLESLPFDAGDHKNLGPATLTPTFLETAPRATHTVQSMAKLTVDRRLVPGQTPDMALREVRDSLHLDEPYRLEIKPGPFMYPAEVRPDGRLMTEIRAGCALEGVAAPGTFWSSGALDAGYLTEHGCEAVMWGPGSISLWHTDNEFVTVDDMVDGARSYFGLMRSYLG